MSNLRWRVFTLLLLLTLVLAACGQDGEGPEGDATQPVATEEVASPGSALQAMDVIGERVADLRGLETLESVDQALLTTEELREKMIEDMAEEYTRQEARDDVLLYVAFELMEPDVDLYDLLIDVQTEQVLGFYDPDTEEMYVVKSSEEPGALERLTFSHEYVHVLQDQHFDLQELGFTSEEDQEEEDSERQFAIRSLVEGDASLLMQQYAMQYFGREELEEVLNQSQTMDSSVLDSAPEVVRASLLFPYEAGLTFVVSLFGDGGWDAVNAAYADPPVSTEQILHPSRYPQDVPQVVTLPPLTDTLGSGWRLVDEDVLGEFGVRLYLDVHLEPEDEPAPDEAAAGWGGDRYAVYWREDETAFVLVERLAWDTPEDASEFFEAYRQFAENRFGSEPARQEGDTHLWWLGHDVLLLAQNDRNETLIVIAPDEPTLESVYTLFPDF
jgi:hypothetical protein